MRLSEAQIELAMRILAGGLAVAGLAVCHTAALSEGVTFLVLPVICAAVVLLTKAQGGAVGGGVGVVVGMSLSIGLTAQSAAAAINQLAFAIMAVTITGLLGYVGGCWTGSMFTAPLGESDKLHKPHAGGTPTLPVTEASRANQLPDRVAVGRVAVGRVAAVRYPLPDDSGAASDVASDFGNWLDDENVSWASFDQFVRTALRGRLAAARVRCFHVGADMSLEPLTDDGVRQAGSGGDGSGSAAAVTIAPSLLQRVVTEREIYIAPRKMGDTGGGGASRGVGQVAVGRVAVGRVAVGPGGADEQAERWSWLLPMYDRGRVCGVVAIGHFAATRTTSQAWPRSAADTPDPEVAVALASVLSIGWRHVASLHALQHGLERDGQSGVLNRPRLLACMDQAVEESVRDGEPVMMMGIVIEGLRGLDDSGDFARRDDLIARLGDALRGKVRTDDIVGRFADDRFIVVLRRLEQRLGRLVAEKLIQTLKVELGRRGRHDSCDSEATDRLFIRASLAGADTCCCDGVSLLSRALALLDHARVDGVELAIDPTLIGRTDAAAADSGAVATQSQESV